MESLPREIIVNHIVPYTPMHFLYVSRHYQHVALICLAPSDPPKFSDLLTSLIRSAAVHSASVLLSLTDRWPSHNDNEVFRVAIELGNEDLLDQLVNHPHFNVNQDLYNDSQPSNAPLAIAITANANRIAKILLARGADPTLHNNEALVAAIATNNTELYDILMNDPRVDPSAPLITREYFDLFDEPTSNEPVITAAKVGNLSIVKQLVADPRVDISAGDFKVFWQAATHGHLEIMKYLTSIVPVIPSSAIASAIDGASFRRQKNVIQWLYDNFEISSSSDLERLFGAASATDLPDIAMAVLKHPNFTDNRGFLLQHTQTWRERNNCVVINAIVECWYNMNPTAKRKRDEEANVEGSKKRPRLPQNIINNVHDLQEDKGDK
eukprot:TRINITY_DN10304_c0_g1_i1.p1 TRINITY_DN10304_c0_g1~~TRINITY_DN10304_c0_g1_i1.p1  ORF type:complete len:381 (+),score=25.07 TRINITY_DN10304_c0_g1_i1:81-1223(+)